MATAPSASESAMIAYRRLLLERSSRWPAVVGNVSRAASRSCDVFSASAPKVRAPAASAPVVIHPARRVVAPEGACEMGIASTRAAGGPPAAPAADGGAD